MKRFATPLLLLLSMSVNVSAQEGPLVTVEEVLLRDTFEGTFDDASGGEVHYESFLGTGAKFGVEVDGRGDVPAPGLALRLFAPSGDEIEISGTNKDKSKPNKNVVKWVNVKAPETGLYRFEMTATGAGSWRLRLNGTPKNVQTAVESTVDLPVGEEGEVPFVGLAGGKVTGTIKSPGKDNKLKGQFTRVIEPDGGVLTVDDLDEKGRLFLQQDGDHVAFFRNIGKEPGAWKVEVNARAPSKRRRKGFVDGDGVTWKPKVQKVQPKKAFHLETALRIVMTGREFQPGLDVRLVKNNREVDILGTDIDWIDDEEVHFTVNLDTRESEEGRSVAKWKVGVWNDPEYLVEGDRSTLVKDVFTFHDDVKFESLKNSAIVLPKGVADEAEVFVLQFSGGFANDIALMGFGSEDAQVRDSAKERLIEYVLLYLRHLYNVNETNGRVHGNSVPVSFVRGSVPNPAGTAGVNYNVLQVGGTMQPEDPRDPGESLDWGFVPFDPGNTSRGVFRQETDEGERVGLGVRTAYLDPRLSEAGESWIDATEPLLERPLTFEDRRYYQKNYFPFTVAEAERMRDIVLQTERVAREIAAVVAHHVAKALGKDGGGDGPLANPTVAGEMYTGRVNLSFDEADLLDLQVLAVPHEMPGKSDRLVLPWFPLATTQAYRLPDALTGTEYFGPFSIFGGRPNARNSEMNAGFASNSGKPAGLRATLNGLQGTPPVYVGTVNCGIFNLRINFTDTLRDVRTQILWQVRVFSDLTKLRPQDVERGRACNNTIDRN